MAETQSNNHWHQLHLVLPIFRQNSRLQSQESVGSRKIYDLRKDEDVLNAVALCIFFWIQECSVSPEGGVLPILAIDRIFSQTVVDQFWFCPIEVHRLQILCNWNWYH